MMPNTTKLASYIYLLLVPVFTSLLGFGVGHVSYKLYLPLWIMNVFFMIQASRKLGLHIARKNNTDGNELARSAFFLIVPWMLISMFAGLGPPPDNASEWTATATEQQVRYFMLVICGISLAFGFAGLKVCIKKEGEYFYSSLAFTSIVLALPLFFVNMLYWGFYLTELFRIQSAASSVVFPDWFSPIRNLFGLISVVEVGLTYFATFAIVKALQESGWVNRNTGFIYMGFSLLALAIIVLSAFFTKSLQVPGFAVSIPAFPFLMPYYLGIHLLRKSGSMSRQIS